MASSTLQFIISVNSTSAVQGVRVFTGALSTLGPTAAAQSAKASTAFDRIEATLGKMKSAVIGFIAAFAFRKAIQGIMDVVEAGIDFESSFTGIKKTLDGTAEQFAALSDQMRQLAKDSGTPVDELNKIAQAAGQMGVAVEDVRDFTETINKIGVTTGMATDEAALNFAYLANILQLPNSSIKVLASTMAALDRESVASSEQILQFSLNIGAAAKQINLGTGNTLALSAALASTGLRSEKAGSAISRVFSDMDKAAAQGGERLKEFAEITYGAGASGERFARAFKQDAGNAIIEFLKGLNDARNSGSAMIAVLEDLGFKNIRTTDVLQRLNLAQGKYVEFVGVAEKETRGHGETLDQRYGMVLETTRKRLDKVNTVLRDFYITLSNAVAPSLAAAAESFGGFIQKMHDSEGLPGALGLSFQIAGETLDKFFIKPFRDLDGLLKAFPAVSTLAMKTMQSFAVVMALAGSSIDIATRALDKFIEASKNPLGVFGEIMKKAFTGEKFSSLVNTKDIDVLKNALARAGDVAAEFQDVIDGVGKTMPVVQISVEEFVGPVFDLAAANRLAHKETVKLTDAQKKNQDQIQAMVDSVTMASESDAEWLKAMARITAAGVPMAAVLKEQGGRIKDHVERMGLLGQAVADSVKPYADLLEAEKRMEDAHVIMMRNLDEEIAKRERLTALNAEIARSDFWRLPVENMNANPLGRPSATDSVGRAEIEATMTINGKSLESFADDWKERNKDIERSNEQMVRGLEHALDSMFENLVKNGTLAWKDIAKFASEIMEGMASSLLAPMRDKLLKPLSEALTGMADSLSEKLAGIFGAIGGAVGGAAVGAVISVAVANAGKAFKWLTSHIAEWDKKQKALFIGLTGGIGAVIVLFSQLHRVANEFVNKVQNPMGDAVAALFRELNAAKDDGSLTVKQVIAARVELERLWDGFRENAAKAGIVGEQAMATMTPIMEQWRAGLVDLQGLADVIEENAINAAVAKERLDKLNDTIAQVAGAADGFDILEEAIAALESQGVPTAVILDRLGDEVEKFYKALTDLGIEVPPLIQKFHDFAEAIEAWQAAVDRLAAVETELAQVRSDLGNVLNDAIDKNTRAIESANNEIEKWNKRIIDLNKEITDAQAHLSDAKFWTNEYNKAIKESEDAYKNAVKDREDTERRIADLTRSIERDRLQGILNTASEAFEAEKEAVRVARESKQRQLEDAIDANDENVYLSLEMRAEKRKILQKELDDFKKNKTDVFATEAAFLAAKKAMEDFDRAEDARRHKEQMDELAALKISLGEQIVLEKERKLALDAAKVAALEQIEADKEKLRVSIANMQAEQVQLGLNITDRLAYIAGLKAENTGYLGMIDTLGILRESTWQTIKTLIDRGTALEAERKALVGITDIAPLTVDIFTTLKNELADLGLAAAAAAVAINQSRGVMSGPELIDAGNEFMANVTRRITDALGLSSPAGTPDEHVDGVGGRYVNSPYGRRWIPDIQGFATGTPSVPRTMVAVVHKGEAIIPASQNRGNIGGTSIVFSGNIVVNARPGQDGKSLADDFVRELELRGDLRRRITRLTEKH